jgi:hypothetical protein
MQNRPSKIERKGIVERNHSDITPAAKRIVNSRDPHGHRMPALFSYRHSAGRRELSELPAEHEGAAQFRSGLGSGVGCGECEAPRIVLHLRCALPADDHRLQHIELHDPRIGRMLFGVLFVWIYSWLTSGAADQAGAVTVKVKMRQCKPCSRNLHLEPQTVDYDYHKMRFVVSKKFVEAIEKENA